MLLGLRNRLRGRTSSLSRAQDAQLIRRFVAEACFSSASRPGHGGTTLGLAEDGNAVAVIYVEYQDRVEETARRQRSASGPFTGGPRTLALLLASPWLFRQAPGHLATNTIELTLMNIIREDYTLVYQLMAARTAHPFLLTLYGTATNQIAHDTPALSRAVYQSSLPLAADILRHPLPDLTDVPLLCSIHALDESQATKLSQEY